LDRNDINISRHYLKSGAARGNILDREKENQISWEAMKDDQMMNQSTKDNEV
jgi:hypothetical protein